MARLEFHNAKERDIDDWRNLVRTADQRFRFVGFKQPPGSRLATMEVEWVHRNAEAKNLRA
jgi:hypothetical protein